MLHREEVEVDGWVKKYWTFTQETEVHVLCETRSQRWLFFHISNAISVIILIETIIFF